MELENIEFELTDILKSGIYVRVGKENKDFVYEVHDAYFYNWFNKEGFKIKDMTPNIPLSIKERYDIIKAFEEAGGVLVKIRDEWAEFEERIKSS